MDAQAPRRVGGDARVQGVEQAMRLAQPKRRRHHEFRPLRARIASMARASAAPVSAGSACSGSGAGASGRVSHRPA
jgi:hypothetical protein